MRYGGLKFIDKVDTSHHKIRDKFHYMDFLVGTKVMTKFGIKNIKENQIARAKRFRFALLNRL